MSCENKKIVFRTRDANSAINIMNLGKCWIYKQQRPSEFCISSFTISPEGKKEMEKVRQSVDFTEDNASSHRKLGWVCLIFLFGRCKWEDTIEFTFPINGGRVIKVYDGDTITIASKLPFDNSPLYRFSVRLKGIYTPKIKGKNISNEEKIAAKSARKYLSYLILNKYVRLENIRNEKYGRILADVYIGDKNLSEDLIKERYAVKYDGGTKKKPYSWWKYQLTGVI